MIFIDNEYRCHTTNPGGMFREVTLSENARAFFDGKCAIFIEGHRYVPIEESWKRFDGIVFVGEMITPWKDLNELDNAQRAYEQRLLAEQAAELEDMRAALRALNVEVTG